MSQHVTSHSGELVSLHSIDEVPRKSVAEFKIRRLSEITLQLAPFNEQKWASVAEQLARNAEISNAEGNEDT